MTASTVNGTATTYAYAGASQNELSAISATGITYQGTFGKNDQNGVPEIDMETSSGATSRILADAATGQALDITDSAGDTAAFLMNGISNQVGALTDTGTEAFQASYDPYGTGGITSGSTSPFLAQNPYGYKDGEYTSPLQNNLVKFGQRWYLPTIGAWTQEDTLDEPLNPSNANRYAYVGCIRSLLSIRRD